MAGCCVRVFGEAWKVFLFSFMLIVGLAVSQLAGAYMHEHAYEVWNTVVKCGTAFCLSFIMINVGYEFTLDKSNLGQYGKDLYVSCMAAFSPWLLVAAWFCLINSQVAEHAQVSAGEMLLMAVFSAPTSAGLLFSMLEAAGLRQTWVFHKARVLAIFDDLAAILMLVILEGVAKGFQWQLAVSLGVEFVLIVFAAVKLHQVKLPHSWQVTLVYAVVITFICKFIEFATEHWTPETVEAIEFEVLLPAFALGALIDTPHAEQELNVQKFEAACNRSAMASGTGASAQRAPEEPLTAGLMPSHASTASSLTRYGLPRLSAASAASRDPGAAGNQVVVNDNEEGHGETNGRKRGNLPTIHTGGTVKPSWVDAGAWNVDWEDMVQTTVVATFMVFVGLSIPALFGANADDDQTGGMSGIMIALHCLAVTIWMIFGKMFPVLCYRNEATLRQRFALSCGMCPRGEVGASVVVLALNAGLAGPVVIVAIVCLAVNLLMCGVFVSATKQLLKSEVVIPARQ